MKLFKPTTLLKTLRKIKLKHIPKLIRIVLYSYPITYTLNNVSIAYKPIRYVIAAFGLKHYFYETLVAKAKFLILDLLHVYLDTFSHCDWNFSLVVKSLQIYF